MTQPLQGKDWREKTLEEFIKWGKEVSPTNIAATHDEIGDWWLNKTSQLLTSFGEEVMSIIPEDWPPGDKDCKCNMCYAHNKGLAQTKEAISGVIKNYK